MRIIFCFMMSFIIGIAPLYGEQKKDPSKAVCVLIDFSESTKSANDDYKEALKAVFGSLTMGDSIYIGKITEKSNMEPRPLINEDFVLKKEPINDFFRKQEKAKMDKKIRAVMGNALSALDDKSHPAKKTAILDSLLIAERVFKKFNKDRAVLVILSDMVEDSKINFGRENLTEKRISQIIESQKREGLISSLNGAKVYVVGASVPKGIPQEKFNHIQKFWFRYFKETGAFLLKENYGAALIGFKE